MKGTGQAGWAKRQRCGSADCVLGIALLPAERRPPALLRRLRDFASTDAVLWCGQAGAYPEWQSLSDPGCYLRP